MIHQKREEEGYGCAVRSSTDYSAVGARVRKNGKKRGQKPQVRQFYSIRDGVTGVTKFARLVKESVRG